MSIKISSVKVAAAVTAGRADVGAGEDTGR